MKFLIDFKNETSKEQIDNYLDTNNCQIIKVFNHFQKVYLVEATAQPIYDDIIDKMIYDESIEITPLELPIQKYFGVDNPSHTKKEVIIDNPVEWWKVFSHDKIDFDKPSFTYARKGSNVDIYLMDSGIFSAHPEFVNSNITNLYSINDNFNDNNGHGTAIASVIVGENCGITSAALKIVKIFEQNYTTRQSDLLSAFDAIISDKQNNLNRASILNISWVIAKNTYIESKIISLINSGVYVVCSAGNSGTPIQNVTPASMPEVITVGSYDQNFHPCDFSNYTPAEGSISTTNNQTNFGELDGWAPGIDILAAKLDGGTAYTAGTSISAGITSAVLAYNLDDFIYDGTEGIGWKNIPQNVMVAKAFFRISLLDIDTSVYAVNSNRILTWLINPPSVPNEINPNLEIKIKIDEPMSIKLFNAGAVQSVTSLDTLPEYLKYSSLGAIIYTSREMDTDYSIETYRFRIVDNSNNTIDQNVKLIFYKPELLGTTINPPDMDTPIKLLYTVSCAANNYNTNDGYQCYFPFEVDGCNENCYLIGGGYYCVLALCPYDKGQDACTCFNPATYSDARLKTNIRFSHMIKDTKWYSYNFIDDPYNSHIGIMAQDLVNTKYEKFLQLDSKGYYLVDYGALTNALTNN